jgi:ATP-binding cassette subfamily F protein uup
VKLGLLGPNGSGKTTLLRILNGDVLPDSGSVKRADGLRIVLFDQEREQVNRDISLKKALAGDSDTVAYRDQRIHISSWAKRFLFHPEQLNVSVGSLSGGEQARILIAQLMLRPADVLILDEPTNDLDIPSLEVLEESLTDFPGAVVLVTHDRYMLDRVSTEILAIDGAGSSRFFADCAQWESVREEEARTKPVPSREQRPAGPSEPPHQPAQVGLTGAEKRELNEIEAQITAAEKKLAACLQSLENPAVIADHIKLHETSEAADAAQQRVDWLYARWEELEAKRGF